MARLQTRELRDADAQGSAPAAECSTTQAAHARTHPGHATGPIHIRLNSLAQFYQSLDPSPFHDRDLDPAAAAFILDEASDRPQHAPIEISLHVTEGEQGLGLRAGHPGGQSLQSGVQEAVRHYFMLLRQTEDRRLRRIFREGRWSLAIGLIAVVVIIALVQLVQGLIPEGNLFRGVVESVYILAWVVLWRPAELLLYDWWPVRRRIALLRRLEVASVTCAVGAG